MSRARDLSSKVTSLDAPASDATALAAPTKFGAAEQLDDFFRKYANV